MRRLKTFFLTLLLALVASSAFSVTFDDGKLIRIGEPVTEVQTGQWYALYSMLGGWIYDANAGKNGSKAYWLTDESNLQTGMVANDVKDYLLHLESSSTEGAYYIQYANDFYVYMYSKSYNYAWSWSYGTTETIVKVEGEETDDIFSIHETGANYCFYTWSDAKYACTSWQTGTVLSNWQANYKYKFYPVEIVDPEPEIGDELQPGDEVEVDGVTYEILSENMVENFDFSDGFTGWTGARDFTTEITNDRFELVEGGALHGDKYLVGTFLGDAANNGALGKVWEIAPYRTYYFSYWVKAYENACDTTDGKWLKTSLTDIPGIEKVILEEEKKDISSEWKKVEVVFTNTDGYAYLQIDFRWLNSQYGLDDFQLYELVQNSETVLEDETEFGNWKIEGNTGGSFQYNTWSTENDPSGMKTPFIEYWVGSGNQLSDATISHETLTDLAPGFYTVSIDARAFNENTLTKVAPGIVLSANGTSVDLSLGTHDVYDGVSAEVYGTYEVPCMVGSDGTLDIAITLTGANCDWLAFKNLKVTFLGTEYELPAVDDVAAVAGDMSAKASEAQEAAIAAYIEEQNTETVIALYQAQAEAKLSANFYAEIAETIADLDEAGMAYFATTAEGAAYEAKTLEYTDMTEVYVASMKQQTTIGKDLSLVVESAEWIGQTGTYSTGVERYGDEIAVTGDEPVKVLYQHIEGLVPGSWYKVEFLGVANNAWVGAAVGDGIAQVFANDVAEGVTVYDQTGCTITDYPHTLTCEVGEDGVLEYGLQNIATGGNWYVAQAISLTIADEVLTDTESDYHIGDIVEIDGIEYEVQSENMVENHSFELGFTGWTSANDFTSEITSAKFDWVNDGTAQDGKRHLVGTTNSSSSSDGSLGTAWAIEPGKTYMMSYWIKNLDGTEETEYLKTSLTNTPGDETEVLGYPEAVDSDWQKVEYVFDNDSYAYVQVKFRWLENHWAFDNFQIYEILAPEEVIEPGDVVHECEADVDHWTHSGSADVVYNDWSVEADASGMVVPFLQLWVWSGDGSSLDASTVSHETLTDLPAGSYEVSLDVRIFSEAGNEIGEGTTFNANEASADLLIEGETGTYATSDYPNMTEVYGTYVLTCTVDEDGILDISINVPEGVEYNWIAWKNLSVTYLGEEAVEPEPETGDVVHECEAEESHWTTDGTTGIGLNTWSVEADASGMVVPFLQLWVWSGDTTQPSLEAATVSHETLTDLEPGAYEVSLDIRIFSEAGNEIGEGTTFNANGASADLLAEGETGTYATDDYPNMTEVYGTYVLTATVGDDGVLDISINIPEGVDYNWLAWKNLSVTYVGEEVVADNSYHFVNTEWVPSDNGRASASQITYNDDNTITINASGANNIAVGNSEGMGAYSGITTSNYIVTNAQQWFVVVASNVATENASDSYLWWMNGLNKGSQEPANVVKVLDDGQVLVAWDIPATTIGDNMTNDENYLDGWTCFGLTSTTGTSTISDINFYTWEDLAVKYPELADSEAIGGVQTGISNVAEDVEIGGIYDLAGRKVSKTVKGGIYIIDGKKVLVK